MVSSIERFHRLSQTVASLSPCVREVALRSVLLHMHAKETHVDAVNLLKDKHRLRSVGKLLWELALEAVPHQRPSVQDLVR